MLSETQISTLERRRAQVLSEIASVGENAGRFADRAFPPLRQGGLSLRTA